MAEAEGAVAQPPVPATQGSGVGATVAGGEPQSISLRDFQAYKRQLDQQVYNVTQQQLAMEAQYTESQERIRELEEMLAEREAGGSTSMEFDINGQPISRPQTDQSGRRLQKELFRAQQEAEMYKEAFNASMAVNNALRDNGILYGDPNVDWAPDARTPTEAKDRILASLPRAVIARNNMISQARAQAQRAAPAPAQEPAASQQEEQVFDQSVPSGSVPSGWLEAMTRKLDNGGRLSPDERAQFDAFTKQAMRRDERGNSLLDINRLT